MLGMVSSYYGGKGKGEGEGEEMVKLMLSTIPFHRTAVRSPVNGLTRISLF